MKKYILSLFLFVSIFATAQESINDYKYVIVPIKYDFQNVENQYRLNTNTKHNLVKAGFKVFYSSENLPAEIANDRCNKLYADVERIKSFLSTNLVFVLKDCQNNIVYKSPIGKSREKDFNIAFPEAFNEAFVSFSSLNYKYNGKIGDVVIRNNNEKVVSEKVIEEPKSSVGLDENIDFLYAQPIANGYQLIDKTPKVILKMYKTSQPDSFTAQSETKNGVVFKKSNEWFFEYYQNDKLVTEKLEIKF